VSAPTLALPWVSAKSTGLTFTDIFCGAGGSSIGLSAAGIELRLAANHWKRAIETHASNFRDADHLCADVNNYDMRRLPRTDILWASPICTEMSPAGGNAKPRTVGGQVDLFEEEGSVEQAGYERTRATFHDVIRATEVHRYQAVLVENVVEVAFKWELFDWWCSGMCQLGYEMQIVCVSAAHVGGEDNPHAPQWRDRLYLVFTRKGAPLPDVAPRPRAWCPTCEVDVDAFQSWRNELGRKIGKYRQQYDYRCPRTECLHGIVEPYVAPAAAAIDWSNPGTRIGDRKRKLAKKTVARIEAGLAMFAQPIHLEAAGNTFERRPGVRTHPAFASPLTTQTTDATKALACPPVMVSTNHDGDGRVYPATAGPLPSRTVKIGDGLAHLPFTVPAGGTWRDGPAAVDVPMGARTARETDGLVVPPFIAELRGGSSTARRISDPLATITAGDGRSGGWHGLTVPPGELGAFYVKNFGGNARPQDMARSVGEPFGTITVRDHTSLVIPFRRGARPYPPGSAPLSTVATHDQHGLAHLGVDVDDCLFRMLTPREHLRAQRFPDAYGVLGTKGEQTMQAGNAVAANVAQWIAGRVVEALCGAA
jgi:DNA (cytosine-5)-methyltransferase 1